MTVCMPEGNGNAIQISQQKNIVVNNESAVEI